MRHALKPTLLLAFFIVGLPVMRSAVAQMPGGLLPTGWRLSGPAGAVRSVSTLPDGLTLSPDGSKLAFIEAGVAPAMLHVVDAQSLADVANLSLPDAFGKPAWDSDSSGLWVGTGEDNAVVHVELGGTNAGTIDQSVKLPQTGNAKNTVRYYPGYIAFSKQLGFLAVSGESSGAVALVDTVNPAVVKTVAIDGPRETTASHPAQLVWNNEGSRLYVALWGLDSVAVIDPFAGTVLQRIRTGLHPEALALSADGSTLYVGNTDDDSISAIDTATNTVRSTLRLRLFNQPQLGLQPNDILVDDASNRLYVSLADANAVAVVSTNPLRQLGAIPTGWYPTGVVHAGTVLVVADAKGESSHANPSYQPLGKSAAQLNAKGAPTVRPSGYIGLNLVGSIRQLPIPGDSDLARLTAEVQKNAGPMLSADGRRARSLDVQETEGARIVRAGGPIKYVFYVIKENRTYDQVLGDEPRGDGDAHLAFFGRQITPNEHALAERFGLFDRTFTDGHVSEDGHPWATQAFANDYNEKTWPPEYASRRKEVDENPYQTRDGYIWDDAARAHVTYRDYGESAIPDPKHQGLWIGGYPSTVGHTAPYYPRFDLKISDQKRIDIWQKEFAGYEAAGNLPRFESFWIMNDHTHATTPGWRTPRAYVADNDLAVGRFVDTISHSRFWKNSAIFIIEDDAQNGPDHVDEQRTTFYLVSPYARAGVQHRHYTQSAVLRTMELILGLAPMSTYDAGAVPLYAAFTTHPNFAPFDHLAATYDINERNAKTAYGAALSRKMDFSHADAVDPGLLNDIIMHSADRR